MGTDCRPASNSSIEDPAQMKQLLEKRLQKGDKWYLVEYHWMNAWKKYMGLDNESARSKSFGDANLRPGPIDNKPLLDDVTKLVLPSLAENVDFELVPSEVWDLLKKEFTVVDDFELQRTVIESGLYVKHCKVEVYLLKINGSVHTSTFDKMNFDISRSTVLKDCVTQIFKGHKMPVNLEKQVYLKHEPPLSYEDMESKMDMTLGDIGISNDHWVYVDVKDKDGKWGVEPSSAAANGSSPSSSSVASTSKSGNGLITRSGAMYGSYSGVGSSGSGTPGLCGLQNLGNTCFMNSALQCMSHVMPLTQYFLSDEWESEVNEKNPLGMGGEMARSFADFIRNVWSGKLGVFIPRTFKMTVGRFAPQFSGYQQQDSQELMAFLLDGLHEDLNRIRSKPYIEMKDGDGRPDSQVAEEAWSNYRKRNDSVIVNNFHGLLKSTVVCPECSKISITFDPFCYLSLPVPVKKERCLSVSMVPHGAATELKQYKLTIPKFGSVTDLAEKLGRAAGINQEAIKFTDVYMNRFHRILNQQDSITNIMDRDEIWAFETPIAPAAADESMESSKTITIAILQQTERSVNRSKSLFGLPILTSVTVPEGEALTGKLVNDAIEQPMRRFIQELPNGEAWWRESENGNDSGVEENGVDEPMDQSGGTSVDSDSQEGRELRSASKPRHVPMKYKLFVTNQYGSTIQGTELKPEDVVPETHYANQLVLYVLADWDPLAAKRLYNEHVYANLQLEDLTLTGPGRNQKSISLTDCLNLFTTTEKLGAEDPWYCPSCKKHQQATKKFDLWSLPDVLIIHFKRFSYTRWYRDKIESLISFPIEGLDITDHVLHEGEPGLPYDLIGVSNHFGGLGGGHYTAYAKQSDTNRWYCFDDSCVSPVANPETVIGKAAYVLVYQRRHGAGRQEGLDTNNNAGVNNEEELVEEKTGDKF